MASRRTDSASADRFWNGLDASQRLEIGDALVLGTFDWREWGLTSKPSAVFLDRVDYQRILWEES